MEIVTSARSERFEKTRPASSYRGAMLPISARRRHVIGKQTVMAETLVRIFKPLSPIVLAILALLIRDEWNLLPETDRTDRNNKGKHCH
jgi:hypothetical protein